MDDDVVIEYPIMDYLVGCFSVSYTESQAVIYNSYKAAVSDLHAKKILRWNSTVGLRLHLHHFPAEGG